MIKLKMGLKGQLATAFIFISAVVIVSFFVHFLMTQNALMLHEKKIISKKLERVALARISGFLDRTYLALLPISENIEIKRLFAKQDRDSLAAITLPIFAALKKEGIQQFQFHLPDSRSFFLAHMPTKYNDDLSSFRFTVNAANREKKIIKGLEEGQGGYGFRVVIPMDYEGRHIGTVEYGLEFGEKFLEGLKKDLDGEYSIYLFRGEKSVDFSKKNRDFLASTLDRDPYPAPLENEISILKTGKTISSIHEEYQISLIPFPDYSGAYQGYIKAIILNRGISEIKSKIRIRLIILTIFILFISLLFSLYMSNLLATPILQAVDFAESIENGDLTRRLDIKRGDEVGALADSLNNMRSSLSSMVFSITENSHFIAGVAEELAISFKGLMATVQGVSTATGDMAKNSRELSLIAINTKSDSEKLIQSIYSVAESSNKAADTSSHVTLAAQEGRKSASHASEKILNFNQGVSHILKIVNNLNEKTERINRVTEVIDSISGQTNLLALNASIEAARAGQVGRGFAVVAEEIRKLADGSNRETLNILEIVSEITEGVQLAMSSMQQRVKEIDEGSKTIDHALDALKLISENVAELADQIEEANYTNQKQLEQADRVQIMISGKRSFCAHFTIFATESQRVAESAQIRVLKFS
ncbi:MAG: hypothetical protein B6244_09475 [Candidatus Cloacimonetes bacterium 4572_55]|nr:MAG: hypothetical protein B6244_09475 [Candidatus Cloacimonetes bacterium 4572_55]